MARTLVRTVGSEATDSASGLLQPVASMSDALATTLGHKQYLHGTNYNGGNAPTVSGAGATTSGYIHAARIA